jgi:hypothetical protein
MDTNCTVFYYLDNSLCYSDDCDIFLPRVGEHVEIQEGDNLWQGIVTKVTHRVKDSIITIHMKEA